MSLHRFKFICCLITFANKETQNDKFACMRELFEDMNEMNARMRNPSPLLAIDQTLHPYRGHIRFKQYNTNKPAKSGLLYRSLCDSSISYTYYSLPYAGKLEKIEGPAAKYCITGADQYSKYLQEINISMDRYLTSVSLAAWAL